MKNKLISVVLPVFNAEKYISESIDSVLSQSFENFELIVINDGSSDSSRDIILSKQDKRIKYFEFPQNMGIVSALNKGLALSKGTLIARMDADDICFSNRFEKQKKHLESNPSADIVGSGIELLWHGNYQKDRIVKSDIITDDFHRVYLLKGCTLAHSTVMMRSRVVKTLGLKYEKRFSYAEDYRLWIKSSLLGAKIETLTETLLKYRVHDTQISAQKSIIQYQKTKNIQLYYAKEIFGNIIKKNEEEYLSLLNNDIQTYNLIKIENLIYRLLKLNEEEGRLNQRFLKTLLESHLSSLLKSDKPE